MRISTKGRYALRLMLDLAINNTGEYISIKNIAARQEISEKYLEQIITQISKAGFVKSVRGAQGGYMLAKDPSEYTVGMILRVMEGELAPVDCVTDGGESCQRAEFCITQEVWRAVNESVESVVDKITLADLVNRYNEKSEPIYII